MYIYILFSNLGYIFKVISIFQVFCTKYFIHFSFCSPIPHAPPNTISLVLLSNKTVILAMLTQFSENVYVFVVLGFQEMGLRSVITLVYRAVAYVRTLRKILPEIFILKTLCVVCVCVCVWCVCVCVGVSSVWRVSFYFILFYWLHFVLFHSLYSPLCSSFLPLDVHPLQNKSY